MSQNTEAAAFLSRVTELPPGPGVSLDEVLKPSLADEAELRKLFAQDKRNSRLSDPYVGLVDVFDAPEDIRKTRARVVKDGEDTDAKYAMPLPEERRRKDGEPAMVDSLEEFKRNWAIFTEGSLSQLLDWNNVVVAGGSVQACLAPVPDSEKVSKRSLRKYYHSRAFPTSDVDVFMYGLTPEQAEAKMNAIFEAVRDSIPWDVTCIRTKHTVSIHSQYPYRAVQIVLRLYQSPAEILAGFDVDAPCCCFDGERVYANPRAIVAMMRQCNTIDVTRRSPSYEVRLSKYSSRDFEVYVPQLNRANIDPTIFERSIVRIQGLARLLVLERLSSATSREQYLQSRRQVRGRPEKYDDWRRMLKKKYKGDLKGDEDAGLEMSDYDVISLHIPYGPGWDAKRIEKLVYTTDLGMNSPFNPKNKDRRLHRHAAFFGTMQECLEDCCEYCPKPKDEEERGLQEKETDSYVRGRVEFIVEDPGRQSISGSFNPIDEGEWAEQAYMGVTEKFFQAIATHDRDVVATAIKDGIDINRRDHVGRTPLQVAILSKATDIACDLIEAGARMTSRLVDGRTALHLSAQLNLPDVTRKLLEKSALNAEEASAQEEAKLSSREDDEDDAMDTDDKDEDTPGEDEDEEMHDSSEDDWASEDDEGGKKKDDTHGNPADEGMIPEDEDDVPDVFDIDVQDWDYALSPLDYAIIAGAVPVLELLLAANANPKLVTVPHSVCYAHPLILTAAAEDEDMACKTAEKLIAAGAVTSEADDNLFTILHRSILAGRPKLLAAMLRSDPHAKTVMNIPWMDDWSNVLFPVSSAVHTGSYATLATLLAYGAKVDIAEDEFQRARDLKVKNNGRAPANFLNSSVKPFEAAVARFDEVVYLLAALGADVNALTRNQLWGSGKELRMTLLDFTRAIRDSPKVSENDNEASSPAATEQDLPEWKVEARRIALGHEELEKAKDPSWAPTVEPCYDDVQDYAARVEALLLTHQGKTAGELTPDDDVSTEDRMKAIRERLDNYRSRGYRRTYGIARPYGFHRHGHHEGQGMRAELASQYEELFAACWSGDNAKIRRLCLPSSGPKRELLQISCNWGDATKGFTPLSVAIAARRWETAKIVIAIATAQYSPDGTETEPTFSIRDLALDDDESEHSDDGCCDEDEDEGNSKKEINLVDIANTPSEVRTKISPVHMLNNVNTPSISKDGKTSECVTPIVKAIYDDDFEAFIQILEMYNALPGNEQPDALACLITRDRPAMLDEYIRRTGQGVDLTTREDDPANDDEDHDDIVQELEANKLYLGLNVHGKKRKDLATKGDPNAPRNSSSSDEVPMLWQAARNGSMGVLRYLASDQPVAAYKFYASSHGDARAKLLKKVPDLAAVLPAKIGWAPNKFNETVVTAAISGQHADVLEALLSLAGKDVEPMLQLQHRGYGFNSLLAGARWAIPVPIFDLLLSKGVSPLETDHRGWNILHLLCAKGDANGMKLLQHVLKHLPKEAVERLLRQQTKELRVTPLHIAIKKRRIDIVELLVTLPYAPIQQHTIRNVGGSTALQLAVSSHCAKITELLIAHGSPDVINLEDGVGNTPLEIANRQTFEDRLNAACGNIRLVQPLRIEFHTKTFDIEKVEKELELLRIAIADLSAEGRLTAGTKLDRELRAFVTHLEKRIAERKQLEEERKKLESQETKEEDDTFKPLKDSHTHCAEILKDALAAHPTPRRLVHLSDVHESVRETLAKFNEETKTAVDVVAAVTRRADDDEETEAEKKGTSITSTWDDAYKSYEWGWLTV